jgi:hypothetical protein
VRIEGDAVIEFLRGPNTVRDGFLTGISIERPETSPALLLSFHVPRGSEGSSYLLRLSGDLSFEYGFTSDHALSQIEMVKCVKTDDSYFYLSLDPWKEDENFMSDEDHDWFKAQAVQLIVSA